MTRWLLALICLVCLCSCTRIPQRVDKFYGGQAKLIRSESCEIFRIEPIRAEPARVADKRVTIIHGHELLDGPIPVPGEIGRQITRVLLDEGSYHWEQIPKVKLCAFEPCVVLVYGELDIMVSFACDRVKVFHGGRLLGMKDIEPLHNQLLVLIKPLFPDDTYIQLLQKLEDNDAD